MMDIILNFAPTGMIPTKDMTPHVPVSPSEIIEDVHAASEIGITSVHLHARDADGSPTYRAEVYREIIEGIRSFSRDLVVCVSLSGRTFNEFERRAEVLGLDGASKPDMGSLTLSSLNFNRHASVNSPDMIQALARAMKKREILAELEVFDTGMINYARYLERKGLIEPPHYFNLLFGNIACAQADLLYAGLMIRDLPDWSYWSLAGIGNDQLKMHMISIAYGGGVRVGLEDNIWFDQERTTLASNTDLIRRIHLLAEVYGRRVMQPRDLRGLLKLKEGDGQYGRAFLGEPESLDEAVIAESARRAEHQPA